ncbi:hypothetical protein Vadar_009871 [Vaccinium darrowii]|uniref:Uncharacterized protein n=1 Tax=Vaccinium darrowii TaxID=229202 RepID=A0ACB7YVA4_9ERIC|nr:hypothetical protein Vadar_009871 [Vaccinium darrowii]
MNEPLFNIDLNQLPNDQEGVIELDEYPKEIGGSMHCHEYIELNEFGKKKDDLVENEIEPFIGRCFLSEEEAFICYKKYACANGFSIKKYRTDKKKGEVKRRDYCCQYEGKAPLKLFDPSKEQRNRISVKCGCKARMRITLRKSCDIFPQEWQVTQFVREHNHELLTPLEVRFLPANRIIIKEDEDRILLLKEGGLSVKQIMRIMELEKGIDHVDKAIDDIQCPPISITKGRPKTKRLKGGKEAGKVTRSCGWCRNVGHNITTCPDKENVEHGIASQRKKKKISSSDMGLNPVFSLKY